MSFSSGSASPESSDGVSDRFPEGLRVLAVDDDSTCLMILEKMLRKCLYDVTTCNRAESALQLLRVNKEGFDIVISDVHMPDMDGFKLLEQVGLEMDLPVIMMSVDDNKKAVMKGITYGACDFLIKPVRMSALQIIWQHVVRKKNCKRYEKILEPPGPGENGEQQQKTPEQADHPPSPNEGDGRRFKKIKTDEAEAGPEEKDAASALRKPRVVWSSELHDKFLAAVYELNIDKAVPKKILELMNVPELTRENVASHLQKHRMFLKRNGKESSHQDRPGNHFLGTMDTAFGESSHNALNLDALAVPRQVPQHPLSGMQAMPPVRPFANPSFSFPPNDLQNIVCLTDQKLRLLEGQQRRNNCGQQVDFFRGIPRNMAPKQLATRQSESAFGNMHSRLHSPGNQNQSFLQQSVPPLARPQIPYEAIIDRRVLNHPSAVPPVLSRDIPHTICSRNGIKNGFESEPTLLTDSDLSGMLTLAPNPIIQEQLNPEMKNPGCCFANFEAFGEQNHNRNHDWVQGGLDLLLPPGFLDVKKETFSVTNELGDAPNINCQANNLPLAHDNSAITNDPLSDMDLQKFLSEFLVQEDPRTTGKEPSSNTPELQPHPGPVETGLDFEEYQVDDLL